MSRRKVVLYQHGRGREPAARESAPEDWQRRFGLEIISRRPHLRGSNYPEELEESSEIIQQLAKEDDTDVFVMGDSAGAMTAESLHLRFPKIIVASALLIAKFGPFDLSQQPELDAAYPSLRIASDTRQEDRQQYGAKNQLRQLWVHSEFDDQLDPEPGRPEGPILPTTTHLEAIEAALTTYAAIPARFFQYSSILGRR